MILLKSIRILPRGDIAALAGACVLGTFPAKAAMPPEKAGAAVPFVTIEAEAPSNLVHGKIVTMRSRPAKTDSTPEMEASGRGFVELSAQGDYLEINHVPAANTLVVRHCIPDASGGGGLTATLSLRVNGTFRQSIKLTSKHNWLYGPPGENGQSNDPAAGQAHVFWDETRVVLGGGGLKPGDSIRLQKDAQDTAAYYRIDLVDLEFATLAPPPAAGTFLSAADFGANGTDEQDDTEAFEKGVAAAKAQGKILWIPRGTYYQSRKLVLDGVTVRGEGMWLTNIIGTVAGTSFAGNIGFELKGSGPTVTDLFIESAAHTSRSTGGAPFVGRPTGWRLENVWVSHTNTGLWMAGSDGVMRGCRVRCTYADGINLNSGASRNIVEHNHVRGSGDDGIALLSETERNNPASVGNVVRFNTVSAAWWGHNCDLAGGRGHLIESNLLADNARFGGFAINLPSAYPMHPLSDSIVRNNVILRGGGNYAGQRRGALTVFAGSTTISNVRFERNIVSQPVFRGIHFFGAMKQETVFEGNIIEAPGEDAIFVDAQATGSAVFRGNKATRVPKGSEPLNRKGATSFSVVSEANSWR